MNSLLAVISIITVAAITPGPNNFIVMTAASRGGLASVLPTITGVVGGSLFLMAIIWVGAGTIFETVPQLRPMLQIAGAAYLVWLGVLLVWKANRRNERTDGESGAILPATLLGVATFQLLNPKSWVLVLTATAAMSDTPSGLIILTALIAVVTTSCLTLWAWVGSAIAAWLVDPGLRRGFDTVMGLLLIGSAGMLLV